MSHLSLVPAAEPDPKQAVLERVKALPRPPGIVQCNRCGSRTVMTLTLGAKIDEKGRYKRGIVQRDRVCYHCDKQGIFSQMLPDPPKAAT